MSNSFDADEIVVLTQSNEVYALSIHAFSKIHFEFFYHIPNSNTLHGRAGEGKQLFTDISVRSFLAFHH